MLKFKTKDRNTVTVVLEGDTYKEFITSKKTGWTHEVGRFNCSEAEVIKIMEDRGFKQVIPSTAAEKRASMKYEKENTVQISLKLNKKYDADIIDFFSTLDESKLGFIKKAIRNEMKREG